MNRSPQRSCSGKAKHATVGNARLALRKSIEQYGDNTLVYYACQHCGAFHIGHPTKAAQRRIKYERILNLIEYANTH